MAEAVFDGLDRAVRKARKRIEDLRARNQRIGEQDTKAALIDPILSALGWDVHDLNEVRREYRRKTRDNPVDYAFFLDEKPLLFLEAKALRKDVSDRKWISQTLAYATVVGVRWCVLSNGEEYRLYNTHAPVDVEEKLLWQVSITDQAGERQVTQALSLLARERIQGDVLAGLWRTHFVDRRVKHVLAELVESADTSLARLINKRSSDLTFGLVKDSLKRASISIEIEESTSTDVLPAVRSKHRRRVPPSGAQHRRTKRRAGTRVKVTDLIDAGIVHAPLALERTYKGRRFRAAVRSDGLVEYNGEQYDSPSTAGGMAKAQVKGPWRPNRPSWPTNGWVFWKYRDSLTRKLRPLDDLRMQYVEGARRNLEVV